MKRKRFTEEQIIRILGEAESLGNVHDVCRQHNITEQTFYRWRNKFGGLEVSDAKRLRELERENAELKRVVGELSLDNRMLKDVLGKCMVRLVRPLFARARSWCGDAGLRKCIRPVSGTQRFLAMMEIRAQLA